MKMWKIFVLLFILLFLLWFLKFAKHYPSRADLRSDADFWGVTFSLKFTKSLGLDWRETYKAVWMIWE